MFVSFSSPPKYFHRETADQDHYLDLNNEKSQISETRERCRADLINLAFVGPVWKYVAVNATF